jgi:ribosomal protein S12 methylthiotransferase
VSSPAGSPRRGGSAGTPRPAGPAARTVSLVTLGCARNEVDSEELAARLSASGWDLTSADEASVVLVNTCGFIQAAKAESIAELLSAAESGAKVAAVGCLAERYGAELAAELPEAQILSFDDYGDIGARLDDVLAGRRRPAHTARDRRTLLPITPADRQPGPATPADRQPGPAAPADRQPGPAAPADRQPRPVTQAARTVGSQSTAVDPVAPWTGPSGSVFRRRLSAGVVAPLKIASGCDRRCSFCAIPSFRGAFVSRRPPEILAEARWLATQGVRELVLVSENSTSYGKDLGNLRLLEEVLPGLAATEGIERVRISYLQPAEMRPGLIAVIASTPGVADYFDLSFQHASGPVLRAMRRFGDRERFWALLDQIREISPGAGVRSNFIVGFPGETPADLAELELFLGRAGLDAIGIFGYSDEDGTEAASRPGKLEDAEIARRVEELAGLADELMAQRAADRLGETLDVLIEEMVPAEDDKADGAYPGNGCSATFTGRAAHQAPEVDGVTTVRSAVPLAPGDLVRVVVTGSDGVDLIADAIVPIGAIQPGRW